MPSSPTIEFRNISKSFGGVAALRGVSFMVAAGTVHAVVGENGAGKSTLMKVLSGAIRADAGAMVLDGAVFEPASPGAAQRAGVAIVHQELSLAPHLSVAENVFLGRWPRRAGMRGLGGTMVDFGELRRRAEAVLHGLGLDVPGGVTVLAGSLSVAQQQMVEIARALSMDCRVLVLDEPSAVLTPSEVERLFVAVRGLTARGVSVLYISHRLEEVFALAQSVTVLRDGGHVSTRPIGEVTRGSLVREAVGRDVEVAGGAARRSGVAGAPVLRTRGLCCRGRFEDVTLEVRAGEVFGLAGLVGSGRSSLAMALFGAAPVTGGWFEVGGGESDGGEGGDRGDGGDAAAGRGRGPFSSVRAAMAAGVVMAPEDRKRQGLLLARPIRENLVLGDERALARMGVVSGRLERGFAGELVRRFGVKVAPRRGAEAPAWTLSGGNQQKVLLARWLARGTRLVILDEPTRGVDVGAKAEIHALVRGAAERGMGVLMVSSDLPELIGVCDRIGVMCRGRLVGVLNNAGRGVSQEAVMGMAVG